MKDNVSRKTALEVACRRGVHWMALCVVATAPTILLSAERDSKLVRRENAKPGARDWQLTRVALLNNTSVRAAYIEGYCSRQSVRAGEAIDICVSTSPPSRF